MANLPFSTQRPPRKPRRKLVDVTSLGHCNFKIPAGTWWAQIACPTHGAIWCAIPVADARRYRAECPECEP